jgi:hypothetical protein
MRSVSPRNEFNMTKKSEEEKSTDQGAEQTAPKKPAVRKTIRRVRKAVGRKAEASGEDQEAPKKDEGSSSPKAGRRNPGTTKRVPSTDDASESREPEARDEGSEDDRRSSEPEIKVTVEAPRKFGRVSKGTSDDGPGGDDERGGSRDDRRGGERRGRGRRSNNSNRAKPEPVDAKALARKAWKLYQADIAEEGIALVDDKAGRTLALRSFDLARIFLEEKARQKRSAKSGKESPKDSTMSEDAGED